MSKVAAVLACDPVVIRQLTEPFIKEAEGLRLHAYADPATKNDPVKRGAPWTIGYGCTGKDDHGNVIGPNTVWTKEEAQRNLDVRLDAALLEVGQLVTAAVGNECYAALISLEYNVGLGNLRASLHDGLLHLVNTCQWKAAADRFLAYDKAAGHVFEPLLDRRKRERELFLKGVPS